MKRGKIYIAAAVGILTLCSGCNGQEKEEPQTVLVQENGEEAFATVTADYGTITESVSIPCTYTATEEVNLSFPVSDEKIAKVYVKKGDFVSKGELLATLDVEELEEKMDEQAYRVDCLELQLEQTRELYEFDIASAQTLYQYTAGTDTDKENLADKKETIEKQYGNTLEDLEDKLKLEKMRLEEYQQKLGEGQIYAGMDGVITYQKNRMQDEFSKADETVMTISGLDSYYFIAECADYMEYFAEETQVDVSYRENGVDNICETVVERQDEEAGRAYLKLLTDEMPENGMSGNIHLEIAQKENALCIPKSALHQSDKGPFVYLYQDGLLEMCYVTIGLEGENTIEITEGIAQGDVIALKK